ncbi:MAG: hypothetical protein ACE5KX_07710, partial [Acidimicrobiia bacterium]
MGTCGGAGPGSVFPHSPHALPAPTAFSPRGHRSEFVESGRRAWHNGTTAVVQITGAEPAMATVDIDLGKYKLGWSDEE